MKLPLFWMFLLAAIGTGAFASWEKLGVAKKSVTRTAYDREMASKYEALDVRCARQRQVHQTALEQIEADGAAECRKIDQAVANQLETLGEELEAKETEQRYGELQAKQQSEQCVPGLFKLQSGKPSPLKKQGDAALINCRHTAYLTAISLSADKRSCIFRYENKSKASVKPSVTIRFFDKQGRFLASAKNNWLFTSLGVGEKAEEQEEIKGSVAGACYFRAE